MIPQRKGTLPKRSLVNVTTAENGMFALIGIRALPSDC